MENNEENLGSQEPETTQTTDSTVNSGKSTNTKLIGIIAVAIVAILAVFFIFFMRSPEAAVKDYMKAFNKYNAKKVMSITDVEGAAAFVQIKNYSYSEGATYDFGKFDEKYDGIMKEIKDFDKDKKKAYEDLKKDAVDQLQTLLDEFKDNKVKFTVKEVKTEKIDDCKKLTKVTATVKAKVDDQENESDLIFYTMKKGLKNYVVYSELGS